MHKKQVGKRKLNKSRVDLHIQRFPATLKTQSGGDATAHFLLNDLAPGHLEVFSSHRLIDGEDVVLEVSGSPAHSLRLEGKVLWCEEHFTESHIVFARSGAFRIAFRLKADAEQMKQIEEFYAKVRETDPQRRIYPPYVPGQTSEAAAPDAAAAAAPGESPETAETPVPAVADAAPAEAAPETQAA